VVLLGSAGDESTPVVEGSTPLESDVAAADECARVLFAPLWAVPVLMGDGVLVADDVRVADGVPVAGRSYSFLLLR